MQESRVGRYAEGLLDQSEVFQERHLAPLFAVRNRRQYLHVEISPEFFGISERGIEAVGSIRCAYARRACCEKASDKSPPKMTSREGWHRGSFGDGYVDDSLAVERVRDARFFALADVEQVIILSRFH